jgi:hypothetical protein
MCVICHTNLYWVYDASLIHPTALSGMQFMPDISKVKYGNDFWIYPLSLFRTETSGNEKQLPSLTAFKLFQVAGFI